MLARAWYVVSAATFSMVSTPLALTATVGS